MKEQIIYGARCTWFGSFGENKTFGNGLPCCPHCYSGLFQLDKEEWDQGAAKHACVPGNEDYVEFLTWLRKQTRCWNSFSEARLVFEQEKTRG